MKLVSSITIIAILLLMPHAVVSHAGLASDNHVVEHHVDIEHDEPMVHVSHGHHHDPHWHTLKFLPTMCRVLAKQLPFVSSHSLLTILDKKRDTFLISSYQAKARSPKQALYLSSCVFTL